MKVNGVFLLIWCEKCNFIVLFGLFSAHGIYPMLVPSLRGLSLTIHKGNVQNTLKR